MSLLPHATPSRSVRTGRVARVLAVAVLASGLAAASPLPAAVAGITTTWSGPTTLSGTDTAAGHEKVTVSRNGTTVITVWDGVDSVSGNTVVRARVGVIAGGVVTWGSTSTVSDSVAGSSGVNPSVALSTNGTTAVVVYDWVSGPVTITTSRVAHITAGVPAWGARQALTPVDGNATSAQVSVAGDGTAATAVWALDNAGNRVIQTKSANLTGADAVWEAAAHDLTTSAVASADPQVQISDDGHTAVSIWQNDGAQQVQSKAAGLTAGVATWEASSHDLSLAGNVVQRPRIALSGAGDEAVATWERTEGGHVVVQARSTSIAAGVATWTNAAATISTTTTEADIQNVVVSADGSTAMATWGLWDGVRNRVAARAATLTGGALTWEAAPQLVEPLYTGAIAPQLAISGDGSSVAVVYSSYDWGAFRPRARLGTVSAGAATWEVDTTSLFGTGTSDAAAPQISLSGDGRTAVSVWSVDNIVGSSVGYSPLPTMRVKIPGTPTVGQRSGIRVSANFPVARWRIEFSRPVRWVGHGRVTVIKGLGNPPFAVKVVWLNGLKVRLHIKVVGVEGLVLERYRTVDPV